MGPVPIVTPLEEHECIRLLSSASVGRVALTIGALPVIRTVRFALIPGHVAFRVASTPATRQAAAGVLAFQVDHYDPAGGQGWQIHLQGRGEELTDPLLIATLEDLPPEAWAPARCGDPLFRVPLTRVSGERFQWSVPPGGGGQP